jgi:gliding motility-associated-like protein
MAHFYKLKQLLSWVLLALLPTVPAWAQKEGQNWYFGNQAGVTFSTGAPVAVTNGRLTSYEGCATLSDKNGTLLAYTNGENVWDRSHQVMPNGSSGLGGHNSASQAALLLPAPNNAQQVYLFAIDAIDNNLVGGLHYSVIDLSAHNGLGDVTSTKGVVLPTPTVGGKITEKLAAVRHANGRDYWIVVHGWQSNAFYSFLLSPSGISTTPVISNIGSVHQGGGSFFSAGNAIGCLKASPDGRHIASAQRDNLTELFDFDNATGSLSNYVSLGPWSYNYGVEFSPDNSRLYVSLVLDGEVMQFNLLAGSAAAIRASGRVVGTGARSGTLQRGPDNKIYLAIFNVPYLDVISNPNSLGTACTYQTNAVSLAGKLSQNGLPNMPNAFGVNDVVNATATFTSTASCAGSAVAFTGSTTPTLPNAVATWSFGDPASGSANTATGLTPTHIYTASGTYQVTLTVTHPSLAAPVTSTQAVTVAPLPRVQLGRDTTLCGSQLLLSVGTQPVGTTYRWQDGSTTATYLARATGSYSVTVTSAAGCTSTSSKQVTLNAVPVAGLLAQITTCAFNVVLIPGPQPAGTTYRWQDGSTYATYLAQASGRYRVTITSPQGCTTTDSVRVTLNAAPPTPRLPADTTVCGATSVLLRPGGQPAGTTYLWQDGSTSATYLAQSSGTYTVRVTTPQGCTATASSRVQLGQAPQVQLRADTLVCPNAVWTLRTNPQPAGTLYRWQDGSTGATYVAHGPGQYSVEVRVTAAGCPVTATLRATPQNCPFVIPNIITPNGDQQNDFFVLKGLTPSDWSLRIFDRWGRQVYDRAHYDNGWNAPGQAAGLYYYVLSNPVTGERHRGWVEVVRGS